MLFHAGLIALLLTWSAADWTGPLFVDLMEPPEAPGSLAAGPSPAPSARPAARAGSPRPGVVARRVQARAGERPRRPLPRLPLRRCRRSPWRRRRRRLPPWRSSRLPRHRPRRRPSRPLPLRRQKAAARSPTAARAHPPGSGAQTRDDADAGTGGRPGSSVAAATPGSGGSGAAPAEYGPYLRQFRQRVQESLVYPLAARRQGLGGTVELHVWLEATGRVRDVQVARSSSHDVLDAPRSRRSAASGPCRSPSRCRADPS